MYYTPAEVAYILNISPTTVRRMYNDGKFEEICTNKSGHRRIKHQSIAAHTDTPGKKRRLAWLRLYKTRNTVERQRLLSIKDEL